MKEIHLSFLITKLSGCIEIYENMCKLENIIRTTQKKIRLKEQQNKGISSARIEFNTNIIFALSKTIEKPLDVTLSLIKEKGSQCLFQSFGKRNVMKQKEIVEQLKNCITT